MSKTRNGNSEDQHKSEINRAIEEAELALSKRENEQAKVSIRQGLTIFGKLKYMDDKNHLVKASLYELFAKYYAQIDNQVQRQLYLEKAIAELRKVKELNDIHISKLIELHEMLAIIKSADLSDAKQNPAKTYLEMIELYKHPAYPYKNNWLTIASLYVSAARVLPDKNEKYRTYLEDALNCLIQVTDRSDQDHLHIAKIYNSCNAYLSRINSSDVLILCIASSKAAIESIKAMQHKSDSALEVMHMAYYNLVVDMCHSADRNDQQVTEIVEQASSVYNQIQIKYDKSIETQIFLIDVYVNHAEPVSLFNRAFELTNELFQLMHSLGKPSVDCLESMRCISCKLIEFIDVYNPIYRILKLFSTYRDEDYRSFDDYKIYIYHLCYFAKPQEVLPIYRFVIITIEFLIKAIINKTLPCANNYPEVNPEDEPGSWLKKMLKTFTDKYERSMQLEISTGLPLVVALCNQNKYLEQCVESLQAEVNELKRMHRPESSDTADTRDPKSARIETEASNPHGLFACPTQPVRRTVGQSEYITADQNDPDSSLYSTLR